MRYVPPILTALLLGAAFAQQPARADLEIARREVRAIDVACKLFWANNRGRQPTWAELIALDTNGVAYLPGRSEPMRDPWGHAYVVTHNPFAAHRTLDYSFGFNGVDEHGQGDDISTSATHCRPERRDRPTSRRRSSRSRGSTTRAGCTRSRTAAGRRPGRTSSPRTREASRTFPTSRSPSGTPGAASTS